MIAHRVDEALDRGRGGWRSYQLFRREHRKAFGQILMGLSTLFVVVWVLILGHASTSFAGGFLLAMALAQLLSGAHEIWAKKRRGRPTQGPGELPSALGTKELPASNEAPAASVAESTTRELKVKAEGRARGEASR